MMIGTPAVAGAASRALAAAPGRGPDGLRSGPPWQSAGPAQRKPAPGTARHNGAHGFAAMTSPATDTPQFIQ
ncbi:hypothetical protein D5047_15860 [Verminephrobacter eiseniae]|nr:hypothetical protein [Verminephrobacter eiseniae]